MTEVNSRLVRELDAMAPFGKGNAEPIFLARSVLVHAAKRVGQDQKHLKLTLDDGGHRMSAIAFGFGGSEVKAGSRVDVGFVPIINEWRGNKKVELRVTQLHPV